MVAGNERVAAGSLRYEPLDKCFDLTFQGWFAAHVLRLSSRFIHFVKHVLYGNLILIHCSLKHVLDSSPVGVFEEQVQRGVPHGILQAQDCLLRQIFKLL